MRKMTAGCEEDEYSCQVKEGNTVELFYESHKYPRNENFLGFSPGSGGPWVSA